jgi:hypothetical protein
MREILILVSLLRSGPSSLVFPNLASGKVSSSKAFERLLDSLGYEEATAHGMRSALRDWVADCTSFPSELAEAQREAGAGLGALLQHACGREGQCHADAAGTQGLSDAAQAGAAFQA